MSARPKKPVAKMTAAQRSAEKHRQGELIILRDNVSLVKKGLAHYPEVLAEKFVNQMKQLGMVQADGTFVPPPDDAVVPFSPLVKKQKLGDGSAKAVLARAVLGEDLGDDDYGECEQLGAQEATKEEPADGEVLEGEELSSGYWKLSSHSVAQLQKYCNHLAPTVLSMPNLKQMVQRGQRAASKQALLELLEFGTGLGADFTPRNDLRQQEQLLKFLAQRHAARGYRLRDLTALPPKWEEQGGAGVYDFQVGKNGKVVIWQTKFGQRKPLPPKPQKSIVDVTSLRIQSNFSETGATLVEQDPKGLSYTLLCSFPDHLVTTTAGSADGASGAVPDGPKSSASDPSVVKSHAGKASTRAKAEAQEAPAGKPEGVVKTELARKRISQKASLRSNIDESAMAPAIP